MQLTDIEEDLFLCLWMQLLQYTKIEGVQYLFGECDLFHNFCTTFENFVNENCVNAIDMKLNE